MDVPNVTCNCYDFGIDRIFIIAENYLHYPQEVISTLWAKYIRLFKENRDFINFRLTYHN